MKVKVNYTIELSDEDLAALEAVHGPVDVPQLARDQGRKGIARLIAEGKARLAEVTDNGEGAGEGYG